MSIDEQIYNLTGIIGLHKKCGFLNNGKDCRECSSWEKCKSLAEFIIKEGEYQKVWSVKEETASAIYAKIYEQGLDDDEINEIFKSFGVNIDNE